ncbi:MAG: GreA/GreB family elongation factor [bacterium]
MLAFLFYGQFALRNLRNRQKRKKSKDPFGGIIKIGSQVSIVDLGTGELLDLKVVIAVQPGGQLDEVSSRSPLGKALFGRRVGESICVEAPKGKLRYQILKITEEE